jgi:hypothetical protein
VKLSRMGDASLVRCSLIALGICAASTLCAQTPPPYAPAASAQVSSTSTSAKTRRKARGLDPKVQTASPVPESVPPPFPTDAAARPAVVNLRDGKLTIQADNSDLDQILHNLASISGMTINGINHGPRVFGVYGPGSSRDVLTDILVGSGYDFIMVGDRSNGAPRELLLTPHGKSASAPASPSTVPPLSDDVDEPDQPQVEVFPPQTGPPGPGAIIPAPSPNSQEDENIRVQQSIQRLQTLHEQLQAKPPQAPPP